MTTHLSVDQIRWWLDDDAVQDVASHAEEETEFNLEVTLSRLPLHLIKEEHDGPVRIVGRSAFDTERAQRLVREEETRTELLGQIGPVLASTPGFYTFLDSEGQSCRLRDADALQMEHRIYPDEATQQRLMDSVTGIATGMQYVQNLVASTRSEATPGGDETGAEEDESRDQTGS
ncbi:hypothetical protein [Salinigranum sp.]|uniref:hypothetical protein n=1 Tax=Salinigranum sp. TaxID=1966351 RepID=UPI003567BA1B